MATCSYIYRSIIIYYIGEGKAYTLCIRFQLCSFHKSTALSGLLIYNQTVMCPPCWFYSDEQYKHYALCVHTVLSIRECCNYIIMIPLYIWP